MARPFVASALLLVLAAVSPAATAHTQFTVSHFTIEVSWQYEPAVVDQPNAVRIAVTDSSASDAPVTDANLAATLTYGGQEKGLDLESSDDTPGEYFGALVPTKAGTYTVHITGSLGGETVDKAIPLEDVTTPAAEGFPSGHATVGQVDQKATMALWGGVGAGLLALIVSVVALVVAGGARKPAPPAARPPQPPARRP